MGVREHVLPVYRRWATFVARTETDVGYSRHRFRCIPSVGRLDETSPRSSSITGEARERLRSGSQYRYFSNYNRGSDDDESNDLREQKSAFFRALEGSKPKNGNMDGQRNKTSRSNPPKSRRQKKIDQSDKNNAILRKRNKTTTSSLSKKLTLDEFFSNLEETKAKEVSPQPNTRKRSRSRISSKDGKLGNQQLPPLYNNNNRNSKAAPAADMNSFFDEVNALMDRKGKAKEELHATTTSLPNESDSIGSTPHVRPSVSDLFPHVSSPSPGNDSDQDDRNSVGYNCSINSWDQYSELLEEVIEGPKFLARFHGRKSENKSEDEAEKVRQIGEVAEWLRSKAPLVETHLPTLDVALTGELSNASDGPENEVKENGGDGETIMTATNCSYTSRRELFRGELDSQRESFLNDLGWTKKQYEVATGALVAMGNLCARNCTAPPLDVAWSKLKELGYPMKNKDVLHNYLYVASTFSLPKRKFALAGERVDGDESSPSVLDLLYGTSDLSSSVSRDDDFDDEIDLSAEVALCHDFLHDATEQSTGIHVRRLVELGRANEAESLVEATMVS